ncbi:MAG: RNA polymerase sigma factor [Kiritimatiellia bacterium]|jgi:RNA polymerase sigma-70 factor (ECF subfamily)|nr:RNA polymerase sigma factor [Kiritimatiellia bacterium]MDP6811197.1 RNA polymerase sigma factor [Kiritimatiellia bacterium]MDP7024358.1 RNA polymerase sigma factor [Kiritimatiellia bacterium]
MEAIVAEYETALLRYTARILNSSTAAQDVVQNTFIKLFRAWKPGMHASAGLKSWLYRVAHNEAVDHIRRESRLTLLHEKQANDPALTVCTDGHNCPMTTGEKHATVLSLMHTLHPREKQVLLLRLEEGLSYKEISRVTGRSEGNVGNLLHHGVRKLSAHLKKAGVITS